MTRLKRWRGKVHDVVVVVLCWRVEEVKVLREKVVKLISEMRLCACLREEKKG